MHYFPYDVKHRLLAHSRSFLANQKARNAIVGAENLLIFIIMQNWISKQKLLNYNNYNAVPRSEGTQSKLEREHSRDEAS